MNPVYIVEELQFNVNNTVGIMTDQFADRNEAESKYHEVLKYAAVSTLPKHSAVLMNEEGFVLKSETYTHEV